MERPRSGALPFPPLPPTWHPMSPPGSSPARVGRLVTVAPPAPLGALPAPAPVGAALPPLPPAPVDATLPPAPVGAALPPLPGPPTLPAPLGLPPVLPAPLGLLL